jgi:hypothetical protein
MFIYSFPGTGDGQKAKKIRKWGWMDGWKE